MQPIHVTEWMLEKHRELLPVYERLGKTEYLEREKKRLERLESMRTGQPQQLQIQF